MSEFDKSEREKKINTLCNAITDAKDDAARHMLGKELLQHIEGEEYFSTDDAIKIILFNGPPRSGKDTASDFAMNILGNDAAKYRFAAPLKNAVHSMFGFKDVSEEHFNSVKDVPNDAFYGLTPRQAYIWLSESVVKPKFGHDFWANVAVTSIKQLRRPVVVVSDCGFVEEANVLIKAFGKRNVAIVHLERSGTSFANDSRSYIDVEGCAKYKIVNDGTVHDLYDIVAHMIQDFTNAK